MTALADPARSENIPAGVAWMISTTFCFVAVTGIVRHVGQELPAPQGAFIRYALGALLMLPFMGALLRRPPTLRGLGAHALRGAVHGAGVVLWFYAMARIPVAEVTALGYVTPLFVTLGAALFLGESLKLRRLLAVLAGILGALVVLRPGFQEIGSGQLAQLAAAPLFAASYLIAKRLTSSEDPSVIVGFLSIFVSLAILPVALTQWVTPSWEAVAWLGLTAVFATAGHFAMTKAFQNAPITVTQPVQFLQLVWATILGIAVFGEPLDPFILLGGAILVGAATYIAHRESRAAKRALTPPAAATKT